ncbi:MAG: N-acetyl-gamma-glutamyl-phosphate reductase [Terriglobales bacterium]
MTNQLQTAVLGATGYSGFELARILLRHPRLTPPLLLRRDGEGAPRLDEIYPHIAGNGGFPLEPFSWTKLAASGVDLLFLATPHELSRELMPEAIARGLRVVDLSGAWRLKRAEHRAVYQFEDSDPATAAKLDETAVYGIPELARDRIAQAQLVANPGCYATSVILGLAPVVLTGIADTDHGIVCDSKSGVSGAGKTPTAKTHFVEVADNLSAYSIFNHRHTGEILEQLGLNEQQLVFTPHLLPIPRGILSTIYVRLKRTTNAAEVEACFREFYKGCAWVRVFGTKIPQIQFSLRTNYCDIGFCLAPDGQRLVIVSCLDNLLKGAAGQAVQNMNVMYGWDEREGLQ